jgi:hypothetical protein
MSVLRLLTTGKSLVGLRSTESPYRLTNQRLLPRFGPTRNPFKSSSKSEPAQIEARFVGDEGGKGASRQEGGSANSCGPTPAAFPSGAQDRPASATANGRGFAKALQLRAAALVAEYKQKLAGIFGRGLVKAAKPAIPRFAKPAVQGELSLDRIRVVRNDLSDADLEVVPSKGPNAPTISPTVLRAEDKPEAAAGRREKTMAGLFAAGKT